MTRSRRGREVLVVPVREEAFAAARKLHVYAVPINRSTSDVTHIAFYRGAPTSAITHYAKVKSISKNMSFQEVFPGGSSILLKEDQPLKVYHLDPIVELKRRVKKGRNPPISGPRYTKLDKLTKARYLDEVWPPEEAAKAKPAEATQAKKTGKGKEPAPKKERTKPEKALKAKEPEPKKRRTKGARGKSTTKAEPSEERPKKGEKEDEAPKKRRKRGPRKKTSTEGEPKVGPKPTVHYIVDGSNVAMEAHTFKEGGHLDQIVLLKDKLMETKGGVVTVIVDANLRHHIDRKDDLEVMINDRTVLQAPAQTDADEFILLTAEYHRSQGDSVVVVSNDRYLDYIKKYKPRFDWVKETQQKFMFVFSPDGSQVLEAMTSIS